MSMQIQTQTVQAFNDYYDNQKTGKRSYSVTIMQPVSVNLELSPMKGNSVEDMKEILNTAKDKGQLLEFDYQTTFDNFNNQKFVVYGVKVVPPVPSNDKKL